MSLKAVVSSLDDVPAEAHHLYVEKDGKFVLNLDDIDAHPAVSALKNAHERTKQSRADLAKQIDELKGKIPDDFDPEEWKRLKDREAGIDLLDDIDTDPVSQSRPGNGQSSRREARPPEADPAGGDEDERNAQRRSGSTGRTYSEDEHRAALSRLRQRIDFRHGQTVQELKSSLDQAVKRAESLQKQLNDRLVDTELDRALDEAKVHPAYRKAARALHRSLIHVKQDEDGMFHAVYDDPDVGDREVIKAIKDWGASEEGQYYVKAPESVGSGANGATSAGRKMARNPWKKEFFNVTEQGRIMREDPQKAARMKAEASAL